MTKIRTFIDADVLIAAARGTDDVSPQAIGVLDDPERSYVTSDFVRLEVLPKAKYHKKDAEVEFYEAFFEAAERNVQASRELVMDAQAEAESNGVSGFDALHVVAAARADCDVLLTAERPSRTIFRTNAVPVTSIRPPK